MSTPPRSQLPAPDDPIADDEHVYRLVKISACKAIEGRWEFQSGAFDNSTPSNDSERDDEMSVVLGDTLSALGRLPQNLPGESALAGDAEVWGVAALNVGFLRKYEEQDIHRSQSADEPAHGDVRGQKNAKRRKRLKKHAKWVIEPQRSAT